MKSLISGYLAIFLPLMISAHNPGDIATGNNKFAFQLYHEVTAGSDKNLVCSPFSISTALAMTYAGARGETALQISQTMNFRQNENFHSEFKQLLNNLKTGAEGKIKLNIANGLWAQKNFKFLDSYFAQVKSNYNPVLKNVDFTVRAEREKTRQDINSWVENETNDKIKNLLSKGDLDSLTKLVLVNAIYFYSEWSDPFEKMATSPKDFILTDQSQVNVPFMNRHGLYKYYEDQNIQAIELPYKGNNASMVIILPIARDGIKAFEKSFDYKYYSDIAASFSVKDVRLSLPKFQASFKIYLRSALSQMGMPNAFSPANADFSGMTGKRDLCISEVIHQAFIAVDEKGTEAAAATAVIMKTTSAGPSPDVKIFNADHPFIFCIADNSTGSILFMGRIMNPKDSK
jgi:serpin B